MIDIERAVVSMASESVDFCIIGGVALSIHSAAYVTYDIDFCYDRSPPNLERIARALAPFGPRLRGFPKELPFEWDASTLSNGSVFTLDTSIGDIDLLAEVSGIGTFSDVQKESSKIRIYGYDVYVLSIEGLIKAKTAAGREKDYPGLKHLEALREAISESEQ